MMPSPTPVFENDLSQRLAGIADPLIREGVRAAIEKTLNPAAPERVYPGHFTVTADGSHFGAENTWPGLDSWEIAGAYLLLGRTRLVRDYFDFVEGSQRADGNIPFAIFPADTPPAGMDNFLRGLRWPEDVYAYTPPARPGQPAGASHATRKWIGLFEHWQPQANPLSVLGPISYLMTADELFAATRDAEWLKEKLPSVERCGQYLRTRLSANGLMDGSGFYIESPPRNRHDGVTQCYAVHAWRRLGGLHEAAGNSERAGFWRGQAEALAEKFRQVFWRGDHFAEYLHPEHGLVDFHGLSDVNWAAIGLDVATDAQARAAWPRLMGEPAFWWGDMPTQLVSEPCCFQAWEFHEPLPFKLSGGPLYDVSAMGRVWWLEVLALRRMGETARLRESALHVCRMGQAHDWLWFERYHPVQSLVVHPSGPKGYCEYAAILVRVVLGNPEVFAAGK